MLGRRRQQSWEPAFPLVRTKVRGSIEDFMRFNPTPSEALFWSRLRGRRLGVRFRRQVVIGSRIVDFCVPSARLVVEVDGDAYHAEREAADGRRDGKLVAAGYQVLRLPASLVERRPEEAVRLGREALC